MLKNSRTSWGWPSRMLHWLMAALILGQVVLGKYAHGLDRSMEKLNVMMWHKSIGISLLLLLLLRLAWTWFNPRPAWSGKAKRWAVAGQRASHAALYLLMFAIPLTGWLSNSAKAVPFRLFRVIPWPDLIDPDPAMGERFEAWHEGLVTAILILLGVHIAAAFWHHFYRRDEVLIRMIKRR
ncbi:MAG TPA: cytochrome b [Xanthomonadales bacterium]|nr:cytochrome b [Xanthomonadales bacterium]